MHFSILLLSRSRHEMLESLYYSIKNTCCLDNEIIVGLDEDDPQLDNYISKFSPLSEIRLDIRKRDSNLHNRMNSMIDLINGKYIFILNDDCLFIDKCWDLCAYTILNKFGDIVYGKTYDNSIDRISNDYAAFPIVSKIAAKKLGFIMDQTFGNHGADVMTYRIYADAKKIVDLPCVRIDHIFHNSHEALSKRQNDKTAVDMISRTFQNNFSINNLLTCDIQEKSNKIKNEN